MQTFLRPAVPELLSNPLMDEPETSRSHRALPVARAVAGIALAFATGACGSTTPNESAPAVEAPVTYEADETIILPLGSQVRIEELDFGGQGGGVEMAAQAQAPRPVSTGRGTTRSTPSAGSKAARPTPTRVTTSKSSSAAASKQPKADDMNDAPEYQVEYCAKGNTPDTNPETVAAGCVHVDVPQAAFEAGIVDLSPGTLNVGDLVTIHAANGLQGQVD